MANANQIEALDDIVPHTTTEWASADLSVLTASGEPTRHICATTTGTLAVLTWAGNERTLSVTAGWERALKVRKILQETTCDVECGY